MSGALFPLLCSHQRQQLQVAGAVLVHKRVADDGNILNVLYVVGVNIGYGYAIHYIYHLVFLGERPVSPAPDHLAEA